MRFLVITLFLLLILIQTGIVFFNYSLPIFNPPPIKIGLVYSSTGFRASREKTIMQANLLAIDEINKKGGVLGRKIEPIIRNGQSNWTATHQEIEDLIINEKVSVIFGCWNAGNRVPLKKLFEKHHHLLINPYQYEGIIRSSNILNLGASANQQVIPTVFYCLKNFGNRFYLVGSNYLFPHIINIMIRDHVTSKNGTIVGESYLPFGGNQQQIDEIINAIVKTKPDVILNSILGPDNQSLFKKLREAGISSDKTPIFSFNMTDVSLKEIDPKDVIGHYATWNYFQSIDTEINKQFIERFKQFSDLDRIDNASEASYFGVYLWAKAAEQSQSLDIEDIVYALKDMRINAPEGIVTIDIEGQNAWKYSRIGKIQPDQNFKIIWQSAHPIRPIPYQIYRSQNEWMELMENLHLSLDNPDNPITSSQEG